MARANEKKPAAAWPYADTPTLRLRRLYDAERATINVTDRQSRASAQRVRAMADELQARGETLTWRVHR